MREFFKNWHWKRNLWLFYSRKPWKCWTFMSNSDVLEVWLKHFKIWSVTFRWEILQHETSWLKKVLQDSPGLLAAPLQLPASSFRMPASFPGSPLLNLPCHSLPNPPPIWVRPLLFSPCPLEWGLCRSIQCEGWILCRGRRRLYGLQSGISRGARIGLSSAELDSRWQRSGVGLFIFPARSLRNC